MAELEFTSGPLAGQTVEISDELVVGRGEADLVIDDGEVSRRHAALRVGARGLVVTDLDSRNGTWIDGEQIAAPTVLAVGAVLRIGMSEAVLVADERVTAAATIAAVPPTPRPETAAPAAPEPAMPTARPGRQPAATRLRGPELMTYATVGGTAIALIAYFALR
jgi:pSer/pThr/pTyr-binding forkhead associated (FHA) protein